jgi:very-long-chain enoyl-CoA reductase
MNDVANESPKAASAFSLSPRFHNAFSYGVAVLVLPLSLNWQRPEVFWIAVPWVFHFARRTFESLFVHRYGGRPIPPTDYIVEYLYYWGFAYWIARGVSAFSWSEPSPVFAGIGVVVFLLGEGGNTWAHRKLRALRAQSGIAERSLPRGGMFEVVSCPHYLFEITSWIGFSFLARVPGAFAFLVLGAGIVTSYALARHRAYKKDFDGAAGKPLYPASRRAIFPFIL